MDIFIARYIQNGISKSVAFNKFYFDQNKAEAWLNSKNIQNFIFFFEPNEPEEFGENAILFKGDVGFDITSDKILPYVKSGKEIILDTFGGDLFEGWKIYDSIKLLNLNPSIGVIGSCASSGMQILLSTENRWISENSRTLIHNPWTYEVGDDERMKRTAGQLEQDKMQLANLYSSVSGKPIEEVLSLMKGEIFLNAKQSLELNFAKEIKTTVNYKQLENMTNDEVVEKLNGFEKMLNKVLNFFKPKNLVIQDVNGTELDFGESIQTVEQVVVGVTATANGAAASGEYVMEDGTVYVFENGTLSEIKAPEMDETAELKKQVEALTAENNALKSENETVKNQLEAVKNEAKKQVETIRNEFKAFQNKFTKDKPITNTPETDNNNKNVRSAFKK